MGIYTCKKVIKGKISIAIKKMWIDGSNNMAAGSTAVLCIHMTYSVAISIYVCQFDAFVH